jgi:hypothetical protein
LGCANSGSLRNPRARQRWLSRLQDADPCCFMAIDQAQRSREIDIQLAWFVVTREPERLAITSMSVRGSGRRNVLERYHGLNLDLSGHAQERMVHRLGLADARTATRRAEVHLGGDVLQPRRDRAVQGRSRKSVETRRTSASAGGSTCRAEPGTDPPTGLAIVALSEMALGEVVTVLDRDQLDDEPQGILERWRAP